MDGEMDKKKTQVAKKVLPEKLQYGKTMENSNSKILSTILGVYRIFRHPDSSGAVRKVDWKTSTLPGYLQYLESKTVHHWLVVEPTPSEKYEFVSWDHYSNIWKNKIHVPNHQPDIIYIWYTIYIYMYTLAILHICYINLYYIFVGVSLSPLPMSNRLCLWFSSLCYHT